MELAGTSGVVVVGSKFDSSVSLLWERLAGSGRRLSMNEKLHTCNSRGAQF
jgi:hypothetical protein